MEKQIISRNLGKYHLAHLHCHGYWGSGSYYEKYFHEIEKDEEDSDFGRKSLEEILDIFRKHDNLFRRVEQGEPYRLKIETVLYDSEKDVFLQSEGPNQVMLTFDEYIEFGSPKTIKVDLRLKHEK